MAEIILFRPWAQKSASNRYPLGLIYIATPLINKGYTVKIIDEETCNDWLTELKSVLDSTTICAGVGVMTGRSIKSALDFSIALKRIKQIPIVWGGIHPSFLPSQTLRNDFVDIIVIGEGEKKFLEIVEHIRNGEGLDNIKGIAFKKNRRINYTESEENFLDLNNLPMPNFNLIDVKYYSTTKRNFMGDKKGVIDLNVDRGCPYRCAFCYNIKFNNRRWRTIDAEHILNMIEKIIKEYNVSAIDFVSDNFFVDKNRVYKICKGIIDRKIDIAWHSDIRIDTFLRYEDSLLKLMKKSGCSTLTFGIESGSDRILKMIDKEISREDVSKAHRKAKNFNFIVNYHFMIGFPEETPKDILETIKLIWILMRDKNSHIYGPSMYVPYPGTPLYDRCCELGFVSPNCLEGWINHGWTETSKLSWFSKDFKNYMNEVQTICRGAFHSTSRKNILRFLVHIYCRYRVIGLKYGIRLFDLDTKIMRILNSILN